MFPIGFTTFSPIFISHMIVISRARKNASFITVCFACTRGIVDAHSLLQLNGALEIRVTDLVVRNISRRLCISLTPQRGIHHARSRTVLERRRTGGQSARPHPSQGRACRLFKASHLSGRLHGSRTSAWTNTKLSRSCYRPLGDT